MKLAVVGPFRIRFLRSPRGTPQQTQVEVSPPVTTQLDPACDALLQAMGVRRRSSLAGVPYEFIAAWHETAVHDVKIVLVGRPGVVVERPNCVITAMDSTRGPSLPKGLPAIPAIPTTYTVYIAHKHWAGIAAALANPEDALVVEGWAAFDPELEGIAVFATFVTTKLTRGEQKRRSAGEEAPR